MKHLYIIFFFVVCAMNSYVQAQYVDFLPDDLTLKESPLYVDDSITRANHASVLDSIIVERYYVADSNDAADTDGGSLAYNATTYRVYVDLKPGYSLNAVFGSENHRLVIKTSTEFFNNVDRGTGTAAEINDKYIGDNTVALDSWITIGSATKNHIGVLKIEDNDSSIIGGGFSDGGSENVEVGLLVNEDSNAGIPITESDGLIEDTVNYELKVLGSQFNYESVFGSENSSDSIVSNDGAWAALGDGGAVGVTGENRILIGQFTTDGELYFELNLQLIISDTLKCRLCSNSGPSCDIVCKTNTIWLVSKSHSLDSFIEEDENKFIYEYPELAFTVEPKTDNSTSVNDMNEVSSLDVKLYPNPTFDEVNLEIPGSVNDNVGSYSLYDVYGKIVLQKQLDNILNRDLETIKLHNLPQGIYFIKIKIGEESCIKRIIKN